MSFIDIGDNELIYLVRNNNLEARDYLISRYKKRMYGFIHSFFKKTYVSGVDYEDYFQECFLVFLKCIEGFDENYNFYKYVESAINKTLIKIYQKEEKKDKVLSLDYDTVDKNYNLVDVAKDSEMLYRENEVKLFIEKNFDELNKAIINYKLEGYNGKEIASLLGVSKKVIYDRLNKIREILSRYLSI